MNTKRSMPAFIAFLMLLFLPILVVAAETFETIKLNLDYPSFGGFDLGTNQDLVSIIGWLYYAIVTISGLAAFAMLVWGGVQWITSSGNPGQIAKARERISDALLGLGLVLGSYLILTIINPGLTTLEQPKLGAVPATTSKDSNAMSKGSNATDAPILFTPPPSGSPGGQVRQCKGPRTFEESMGGKNALQLFALEYCAQRKHMPTDSQAHEWLVGATGSTKCTPNDVQQFQKFMRATSCKNTSPVQAPAGNVVIDQTTVTKALCYYSSTTGTNGFVYDPPTEVKSAAPLLTELAASTGMEGEKTNELFSKIRRNVTALYQFCAGSPNPPTFCYLTDQKTSIGSFTASQQNILSQYCFGTIPGGYDSSKFACPVPSNQRYNIGVGFTSALYWRDFRHLAPHNGIDVGVGAGTPVFSPAKGTVTSTAPNASCGNSLIIQHERYETKYCHLQDVFVREGESVLPGQYVATSGNSGDSSGAHLHFQVGGENAWQDPRAQISCFAAMPCDKENNGDSWCETDFSRLSQYPMHTIKWQYDASTMVPTEAGVGDAVRMVIGTNLPTGTPVTFELYEYDPIFPTLLERFAQTVDQNGDAVQSITISEEYWNKGQDFLEGGTEEFYFVATATPEGSSRPLTLKSNFEASYLLVKQQSPSTVAPFSGNPEWFLANNALGPERVGTIVTLRIPTRLDPGTKVEFTIRESNWITRDATVRPRDTVPALEGEVNNRGIAEAIWEVTQSDLDATNETQSFKFYFTASFEGVVSDRHSDYLLIP